MRYLFVCLLLSINISLFGQFTRQDTLRGSITPERSWWELLHYNLQVAVDPSAKSIKGQNDITYQVLKPYHVLQIDLQSPLKIDSVLQDGKLLKVNAEGNAHFISISKEQIVGSMQTISVYYSGIPVEAVNPPWDGGITWVKDKNDIDFIASSCQGIGASVWWPCKDHMYDEPDSMNIHVTVPEHLMDVSNGRFIGAVENGDGTKTYSWKVINPINNYGVNINIGDYVTFEEQYEGEKGSLDLSYYVLRDNLGKAKRQFKQVPLMLEAFEHWFGPYPFYEDGFKLVEAPYLGMEHQSSVTYGNGYQNGYLGRDWSQTGWGLKFDFIIIHESGHEWFANNITYKDAADMWIHESFTNYSECLYLDYHYGKKAAADYVIGTRTAIRNDIPIIGIYGVNQEGSSDMYWKGGNLLHMLRTILDDDTKWREILRGLNEEFYHQTVTTEQIEGYINDRFEEDLSLIFDQYLRTIDIPEFQYRFDGKTLHYRWANSMNDFNMVLDINIGNEAKRIRPSTVWQIMKTKPGKVEVDRNFYITSKKVEK